MSKERQIQIGIDCLQKLLQIYESRIALSRWFHLNIFYEVDVP